ncbi:hypothetical protein [Acaryochloris marina]|uniref:hypothetical protein n=1 Tax=Acaryochloris marina TaxID=155978 RepID=UPI001BB0155A|nr:hypothetical protein [Acaryochloris marina]QUY44150.1 hypothetical protein I1H34_08700 [Acaryochloris marina S15]
MPGVSSLLSTLKLNIDDALVKRHGDIIRAVEAKEVEQWKDQSDLSKFQVNLIDAKAPRHRAAWPIELTAAVEQALANPNPKAPEGVTHQDWQRVLQARNNEAAYWSAEKLRCLGPEIQPGQTIAATDDILVRQPQASKWLTMRVARIATTKGCRYLSGTGSRVLRQLSLMLFFCAGLDDWVTLLGDGAEWLRNYFETDLSPFTHKELLLDWYHLRRKCADFSRMICLTREEKKALKRKLNSSL